MATANLTNIYFPTPRKRKYSMSILYWVLYVLFFTIMQPGMEYTYLTSFYIELISLPLKIVFVTIVLKVLMERFLFNNKIWLFVICYIPILFLFVVLQRLIDNYVNIDFFLAGWSKQPLLSYPSLLYNIIKFQFVATIPFSIKLFSYWAEEQKKAHAIREEKSQAELNFLRNQFHPHFIFNALNSLYSKILSKSEESADIVLKISSLLRFSIYDINAKAVSLDKEISYLKDYISLQRIRFDKQLDLSFTIEGDTENKIVEPFLIIPFVENSFKYCIGEQSATGWITISISILEDWLTLKIENSKDETTNHSNLHHPELNSNGVGLNNVKRRLQLLYPGNHSLKITSSEDSFFVFLKFKLDTNDH